jgi:stage II sporulation protein D
VPPSRPAARTENGAARRARVKAAAAALLATALLPLAPAAASAAASAAPCPAPGGQPAAEAAGPADAEVVITGHGYGHSMGMSQYGAQGAATLGCGYATILGTYYPGLRTATVSLANRVLIDMLTGGGSATVAAEEAPVSWWRSGSGTVATQPVGTTWTVRRSGDGLVVRAGTSSTSPAVPGLTVGAGVEVRALHDNSPVRVRTFSGSGSLHLDRRAGHDYTRFLPSSRGLNVREVMEDDSTGSAVQKYLRGLAELPVTWHVEAHKAQIVAARTYLAGRYSTAENGYLILPTPTHQNWTGATQEEVDARYGGTQRAAVRDTTSGSAGVVMVTSTGALARDLLYTSSHGGWSESNTYVYGTPQAPHLRQVDDSRWDEASRNPRRSWAAGASYAQLAQAFGFDTVSAISAPRQGTPERTAVTVTGVDGGVATTRRFTGWDARQRLQRVLGAAAVPSPGFTFDNHGIGGPDAVPLVGDVDGDGREDLGWFRAGRWAFLTASGRVVRFSFGSAGDVPVLGDWSRSGTDGIGVFRAGQWLLRATATGGPAQTSVGFGRAGDTPVVGAWPGAGRDGIGVVRGGVWHLRERPAAGPAQWSFPYGVAGDVPVVGDWDRDGTATPGIVRRGTWHLATSVQRPVAEVAFSFGRGTDRPVPGDWDGNGSDTAGVVRGSTFYGRDLHSGGGATFSRGFAG